ncbi:MAG: hypothetical protein QOD42_16 [Sphingomonadales bacterium]|nr:hypothetical protein [Sphingomonadales bacterium]
MISSVLAVAMAASMQPADTTRAAREAFTGCLRTYVDRSLSARMAVTEFTTAYPQQCSTQEQAYRDAVIRRETASRMSAADARESATMEIDDARTNFRERYEMAQPATPPGGAAAAQTAAQTPAQPAGQTGAQPAAQAAAQQPPAPQTASSPN